MAPRPHVKMTPKLWEKIASQKPNLVPITHEGKKVHLRAIVYSGKRPGSERNPPTELSIQEFHEKGKQPDKYPKPPTVGGHLEFVATHLNTDGKFKRVPVSESVAPGLKEESKARKAYNKKFKDMY